MSVGWDGAFLPRELGLDPVCQMCRPVCEACWHPDLWADHPERHVHEASVPMLTLYTARLDERPQHGRSAVWAELARTVG